MARDVGWSVVGVGTDDFYDVTSTNITSAFTYRTYHGVGTRIWLPTWSTTTQSSATDVNSCGDVAGTEDGPGHEREIVIWLAAQCDS